MPSNAKKEWQEWVSSMTHAYNCMMSKTTGFAPYFLMFGREPKLPIDIKFNLPSNQENATPQTYVERLKEKLEWAFEKAQDNIQRDMISRKRYHDKSVHCHKLEIGDLVLLRDKKPGSNYKIADQWVDGVFEVVSQKEHSPVFKIKQIGSGVEHVIHRNMIHLVRSVIRDELLTEGDRVRALAQANTLMDILFSN